MCLRSPHKCCTEVFHILFKLKGAESLLSVIIISWDNAHGNELQEVILNISVISKLECLLPACLPVIILFLTNKRIMPIMTYWNIKILRLKECYMYEYSAIRKSKTNGRHKEKGFGNRMVQYNLNNCLSET